MGGAGGGKKKKKKRELKEDELLYTQLDEEIYARNAELAFNFKAPVPQTEAQRVAADGMAQYRRVVVFDAAKAKVIQKQLSDLIGEDA